MPSQTVTTSEKCLSIHSGFFSIYFLCSPLWPLFHREMGAVKTQVMCVAEGKKRIPLPVFNVNCDIARKEAERSSCRVPNQCKWRGKRWYTGYSKWDINWGTYSVQRLWGRKWTKDEKKVKLDWIMRSFVQRPSLRWGRAERWCTWGVSVSYKSLQKHWIHLVKLWAMKPWWFQISKSNQVSSAVSFFPFDVFSFKPQ